MRYIGTDPVPLAVSPAQFAAAVHGVVTEAEEASLESLLGAAQDVVSTATNLPPAPGLFEFTCPVDDWRRWWFPCRPVTAIEEIAVSDAAGAFVDRDLAGIQLVMGYDEPQLLLPDGWLRRDDQGRTLRIRAQAGETLSPALWRAIVALTREWRDADIAISGEMEVPRGSFGVQRLLRQARYRRPKITAGC
ncbi:MULTISPECIES: hypothetical protein [Salipiger]|jgi:hypothetical protein|uniref:PhiE125 gp8 family phage protein n=1 Tax=Salipiger profundus TaxID=1229727 RepID=A0A1U7D540_9RHOB|nr:MULTISPECIES: hypothetical protein [Salipiger]APX23190.1 hypothetical protein Ga0080559_TMP2394 [Salipiger profundus]GGA13949.1 hypothetical protein GCM10011326_27570 [Salipiger profundus]SFD16233.1 hypothetical protein SAMN05444415_1089 [Salipiger profundus]